jgi:hypothetical protein
MRPVPEACAGKFADLERKLKKMRKIKLNKKSFCRASKKRYI